jgi:hypothetical protein
MPGMATPHAAFLGGWDKPGHDGFVGMGAPDQRAGETPADRENLAPKHAVKAGVSP